MGRKSKFQDPTQIASIISRYVGGESAMSIARSLNTRQQVVVRCLVKEGISIRGRSAAKTVHLINHNCFKTPLSPSGMYLLGVLVTDGCISDDSPPRKPRVRLSLQKRDILVVEYLKSHMGFSGPIQHFAPRSENHSPMVTIEARSVEIVKDLNRLGCTPRKTHTLKVHEEVTTNRDFWRGVVDGDGFLTIRVRSPINKRPVIGVTSASIEFAKQISSYFTSLGLKAITVCNNVARSVTVSGSDAIQLSHILYDDCCFAMPRKLEKAKEIMSLVYPTPMHDRYNLRRGRKRT